MRCTNNYEDYLKVTVEDVKRAGFTERYPKYRCGTTYYVKDSCEYVLARTGGNFWVILDKKTYEFIGGYNIHMNNKGRNYKSVGGILVYIEDNEHRDDYSHVPRIRLNGKDKMLHRVVMNAQKDVQVDHINHNQCCCIEKNLRCCTNEQNTINRQDRCGVWGYSDEEGTYYAYDLEANGCNKKRYDSIVDCYLGYRNTARELYKGTGFEDFVYDIRNDFSETLGLLIHYYILGDITDGEMDQMNLDYWRDTLDNAPIAIAI